MLQEVGWTRSSGTVRNLKIVASEMFKIAVQDKLRDDNPVAGIKVRARPGRSMVIATREQARAIEEAIDPHYRLLVRTLFATGCR
jgi:integrase